MERFKKGVSYAYVSISHWKVCVTHDNYFDSDNERYEHGNYFQSSKAAGVCFTEIAETYGDRIHELKKASKTNAATFLQTCCALAVEGKGANGMKGRAVRKKVCEGLVEAYAQYKKTESDTEAELAEIKDAIQNIIRESSKTL